MYFLLSCAVVSSSSSFCPPAHDDRAHCKEAKDDRACSESDDDEELSDSDGEESHSLGKDDDEKDCELAGGTFLESTSSIMQTCSCCNKYQKYASASSTSNNRMKDRVFNLSLRELRVSICMLLILNNVVHLVNIHYVRIFSFRIGRRQCAS